MKKMMLVLGLVLSLTVASNAQTPKPTPAKTSQTAKSVAKKMVVPAAVKATVKALYPNAKEVEWELEKGNYEASIEQKGQAEISVLLTPQGEVLETETEITTAELPEAVRTYVAQKLGNAKIKEAAKIVKADGSVEYEAEVGRKDYMFDSNGQFLKVN